MKFATIIATVIVAASAGCREVSDLLRELTNMSITRKLIGLRNCAKQVQGKLRQ